MVRRLGNVGPTAVLRDRALTIFFRRAGFRYIPDVVQTRCRQPGDVFDRHSARGRLPHGMRQINQQEASCLRGPLGILWGDGTSECPLALAEAGSGPARPHPGAAWPTRLPPGSCAPFPRGRWCFTRLVSCVSIMKLWTCFSALVSSSFRATTATTRAVQPAPCGRTARGQGESARHQGARFGARPLWGLALSG